MSKNILYYPKRLQKSLSRPQNIRVSGVTITKGFLFFFYLFFFILALSLQIINRERSGSVVECLTRDRRAAGSSLTGVTALCP